MAKRKPTQTGKTTIKKDRKLRAKPVGKRISKNGNVYYEYRKNRTDIKGVDTPISKIKKVKLKLRKVKNAEELKRKRIKAYNEKKEAKIQRLKYLAQKTKIASNMEFEHSRKLGSMIPFGQPILVGHHSERTHRNHIKKIDNAMRKSVNLGEKAEYYAERLKSAENDYAISSDDPEAVKKLKEKVNLLENKREKIKQHNLKMRKEKTPEKQYPSFVLSNLGQVITNAKKRIIQLNRLEQVKPSAKVVKGVKVINNTEINRVQLEFPDIPNVEIRKILKSNGFRWSPSQGRWQRQLNSAGLYAVKRVMDSL